MESLKIPVYLYPEWIDHAAIQAFRDSPFWYPALCRDGVLMYWDRWHEVEAVFPLFRYIDTYYNRQKFLAFRSRHGKRLYIVPIVPPLSIGTEIPGSRYSNLCQKPIVFDYPRESVAISLLLTGNVENARKLLEMASISIDFNNFEILVSPYEGVELEKVRELIIAHLDLNPLLVTTT